MKQMKFVALSCLLLAGVCSAAQTYTASGNFATDLLGVVDTRTDTWGSAASFSWPITFAAPPGQQVQVLSVRGDVVAFIKSMPGDPPTPPGSSAGVLASFSTTSPSGSTHCTNCADNCGMYVQGIVTEQQPSTRSPFAVSDFDMTLNPDGILEAKVASWLNTTGKPIHIELTYTVKFTYMPAGGQ
jgi:hypothetical protein